MLLFVFSRCHCLFSMQKRSFYAQANYIIFF